MGADCLAYLRVGAFATLLSDSHYQPPPPSETEKTGKAENNTCFRNILRHFGEFGGPQGVSKASGEGVG